MHQEEANVPTLPIEPKSNKLTIISVAIFILLSLASVVFLYNQNQQLKKMLASYQPQPSSTPNVQPTPDPTTDWKTYTNEKLGFSFKYPLTDVLKSDTLSSDGNLEFSGFVLYVEKTNETLDKYVTKLSNTNNIKPVTKTINGVNSIEWMGSFKNAPSHYISFENGGYIYNIGITPVASQEVFELNNTDYLTKLFSTFKFLDESNQIDSTNQLIEYLKIEYYNQGKQYGKTKDSVLISIKKVEGNFAIGTGGYTTGGGDVWFAVKSSNGWGIVEQTQEPPSCKIMDQYNFPKLVYGECIEK